MLESGAFGQQFLALAFVEEKAIYESCGRKQEPKTAAVSHAIDDWRHDYEYA